jgi:outer membrane autotransporter protein
VIENLDYGFDPEDTIELELSVSSLSSPQPTPPARVRLTGVQGPEVNLEDPAQELACGDPNAQPIANAGQSRTVIDTGEPGEPITLDGSASSDANPDNLLTYLWRGADTEFQGQTVTTPPLPPGTYDFTLTVTDDSGDPQTNTSEPATVTITIAAGAVPVVNAGEDRTVSDTDGEAGELVTLSGSATASEGTIVSYQWLANDTVLGTDATIETRLPDGVTIVQLIATDSLGQTGSDTVSITVTPPPQMPIANAGPDATVADTDREAGEIVTLDGSASSSPLGEALTYQWSLQADPVVPLGDGETLSVRLPDGANTVMLRVEDASGNSATDTVVVTVGAPAERAALAALPNLTPNKLQMARALDRICVALDEMSGTGAPLTPEQQSLNERCNGLYFDNSAANQSQALEELGADDFAAARTQTLLFSNTLHANVMDRLVALRGGARGLSLAGLNIMVDGRLVPLAQLQEMVKGLLGGGASSDADEAGGLFADKLGIWVRGNYSVGEKDRSAASPSFEADQWSLMGGIDYRLSAGSVLGGSFAYGQSGIDFNPSGEGSLDTTSWAASLYGSVYAAKNFYFDAIANFANSDYDAERNITYVDGTGLIAADAHGTTDGLTISGGVSGGYDFLVGGFTISPTLGVFYIDATIDGFTESGAAGLNLIYDEQNFSSLTGNLGLRATYAWNTSWGVLLPHVRVDYVREFEDDVDVFGVRFAADPNANSTPPILVETDNPDRSYWRLATGLSAQFAQGFSGYIEYQRLESFQYISFQDVSVGLRMQRSF